MTPGILRSLPQVSPVVPLAAEEAEQASVGLPSLFLLVLVGSLVPVIPTGALVSSAGVVAFHHSDPVVFTALVFAAASLAALCGDLLLFALGRGGTRWLRRLREQAAPGAVRRAQRQLAERGTVVLVVSRLVPGGRIPVMLAALLTRMPVTAYARGCFPAALAWAATYQLIGLLGGALFPHPWQGVLAAVALALLFAAAPHLWRRVTAGDG
ncbi:VTT domain-containing protein [Streptomyces sp. XM4011]|uniref:DedA family protein n=1 Tax=Streptomyces sp. XM4011 TaxID=2929780 RepID=UPI001FF94B0E|nr:VTT domain-containing protein [Streptomyces sp. XM4011]MCK1815602.1 VTT domain-containing protein [Streptomyces sp. XM4011]